jgi:hypothetical protein
MYGRCVNNLSPLKYLRHENLNGIGLGGTSTRAPSLNPPKKRSSRNVAYRCPLLTLGGVTFASEMSGPAKSEWCGSNEIGRCLVWFFAIRAEAENNVTSRSVRHALFANGSSRDGDRLALGRAHISFEPAHHVELSANKIRRLRASPVVLSFELQQFHRHAANLQRGVVLLGLRHGRPAVQHTSHQQRGRGHFADRHHGRMREPIAWILPEWLLKKAVGEEGYVGIACHAHLIYDRAAHGSRRKTVRVADHPTRKYSATTATRDGHARGIDEAFGDRGIHSGHQIVVVGPRIVVVDSAGKSRSVPSAATWVDVENHEIVGGEILEHVVERNTVHGKRPTVDFKDERVLFRRVEIRWLHAPALHFRVASGSEVYFLRFHQGRSLPPPGSFCSRQDSNLRV